MDSFRRKLGIGLAHRPPPVGIFPLSWQILKRLLGPENRTLAQVRSALGQLAQGSTFMLKFARVATSSASSRGLLIETSMSRRPEIAILAGGCFYGMQYLLRRLRGVLTTRVGYTGGDIANATYDNQGTHAEAIEVVFDQHAVSYRDVLEYFFQIHDPTTRHRQGNDHGLNYRSAIYYVTEEQRLIAEKIVADVDASNVWPAKVVTEIAPAGDFWEAECEHQDYLERYPDGHTCHFVRPDWKLPTQV